MDTLKKLAHDIFKEAEGCPREGVSGIVIDSKEISRQRDSLTECVKKISSLISDMEYRFNEATDCEYKSRIRLFSNVLIKYSLKYSLFDKFDIFNRYDDDNYVEAFSKYKEICLDAASKISADNIEPDEIESDKFDTFLHNLEPMRKCCFVFCLAAIDTVYPRDSVDALINKAIVFDALKDGYSLYATCDVINSLSSDYPTKNHQLLWECGTLHYKIRRYSTAILYFNKFLEEYTKQKNISEVNADVDGYILDACYKIAYCYEFSGEITIALYIFVELFKRIEWNVFDKLEISQLESIDFYNAVKTKQEVLVYEKYFNLARLPNSDKEDKVHTELLHGISHIINEFVLFHKDESHELGLSPLLRIANRLMYAAAIKRDVFFTCLGTNHTENKEFNVAISIFNYIIDENMFVGNRLHLKHEVIFYQAHAHLFYGKYDKANEYLGIFKKYCKKLNDTEGLSHLTIYETYLMLMKADRHSSIPQSTLINTLTKLETNKPSLYSTKKVQEEWGQLYHFVQALLSMKALYDGDVQASVALDETISNLNKCIRSEGDGLSYCYKVEEGKYIYRITSKMVEDSLYIFSDDAINTFKDMTLDDDIDIGESVNQSITNNSANINWATRKVGNRNVRWYIPAHNSVSFKGRRKNIPYVTYVEDAYLEVTAQYAYIDFMYNVTATNLLKPKYFLGLTPNRMTQLYKYNIRRIKGLHDVNLANSVYVANFEDKLDSLWSDIKSKSKIDVEIDEESKKLESLISCMKAKNADNLLAAIYIPEKNKHWHYNVNSNLLNSGYSWLYYGKNELSDEFGLSKNFTEMKLFKDPYFPEESEVRRFISNLKRANKCNCPHKRKTECVFSVFNLTDESKTDNKEILRKVLRSISFLDANLESAKSMLTLKIKTDEYFIAVFNEVIDEKEWKNTICEAALSFYNILPSPATFQKTEETPSEPAENENPPNADEGIHTGKRYHDGKWKD